MKNLKLVSLILLLLFIVYPAKSTFPSNTIFSSAQSFKDSPYFYYPLLAGGLACLGSGGLALLGYKMGVWNWKKQEIPAEPNSLAPNTYQADTGALEHSAVYILDKESKIQKLPLDYASPTWYKFMAEKKLNIFLTLLGVGVTTTASILIAQNYSNTGGLGSLYLLRLFSKYIL